MWRYFFLFIVLGIQVVKASDPQEIRWQEGVVLLLSDEVVTGQFSLNLRHQLVIRKKDKGTEVIPVHRIRSFRLYDKEKNILRKFKVLDEGQNSRGSLKRIFEVVINGEVQVIRKRSMGLVTHVGQKYAGNSAIDLNEEAFNYVYFILYKDNIIPLLKFRRKVMSQLAFEERTSLKQFMKANKLSGSNAADIIVTLKFYNQWLQTGHPLVTMNGHD